MSYFKNGTHYRTFVKDGVKFFFFKDNGEKILCTGNPTGTITFECVGDVADIYTLNGATSVVSGCGSLSELYQKWLRVTSFPREVGLTF